ncbi:hypothetical protein ACERIT_00225 [Halopenitus sp. H-Gu1]|uniref:DUF7289 family protein n=1 Tax=Halopenitus sp. H-Gu1 TaxID=3242697 RepID=UPI00359D6695
MTTDDRPGVDRGNATVVGVALLIGITVASMGVITAGMGVVIEDHARTIEADRVTAALTTAIEETAAPGHRRRRLPVSAGRVETVERTVRVERDGTWTNWEANGIRYVSESGTRRVETVAGAVIRGEGESAVVTRDPSILASDETVAFTLPVLTGETHMAVSGTGVGGDAGSANQVGSGTGSGIRAGSGPGSGLTLETTVRHDRRNLGVGTFRVAIETPAPAALARSFERVAATAGVEATVERTTFPGDAHPSVVLTIEDERARHMLVREVTVEVRRG